MKTLMAVVILIHSQYPPLCCNGDKETGDCHPVPCDSIVETAKGYEWNHIQFTKEMGHVSFNDQCHVCVGPDFLSGTPIGEPKHPHCIFIRPTA